MMQRLVNSHIFRCARESLSGASSCRACYSPATRHYTAMSTMRNVMRNANLSKAFMKEKPEHLSTFIRRQLSSRIPRRPTSMNVPQQVTRPDKRIRVTRDGYTHFGRDAKNVPQSPISRYILMFCSGGFVYYVYRSIDYAPFTDRIRLIGGVSRELEIELGRKAFEELLQTFEGAVLPVRHPVTQRVRKVTGRLARTVLRLEPGLCKDFEWSVAVADVPLVNAMCAPGGRILVTSGMLRLVENDDELAIILGHEITHALNRHSVESISLTRLLWPILLLINYIFDLRYLPSLAGIMLKLRYSRQLEYEADHVGTLLCAEACYNPTVATKVFKKLDAVQKMTGKDESKMSTFFSTHPLTSERVKQLEKDMPEQVRRFKDKCPERASRHLGQFSETMMNNFGRAPDRSF